MLNEKEIEKMCQDNLIIREQLGEYIKSIQDAERQSILDILLKLNRLSTHCDNCCNSKNHILTSELCDALNLSFIHFQLGMIKELESKEE